MRRSSPAALVPALTALCVLALAGCGSDDSNDSGTAAPSAAPSAATTSTTTAAATPAPSGSSPSAEPAAEVPLCGTPDLLLSVKAAAGGASAGAAHQELTFSNETDHACTITGWPGVSYVAGKKQVGAAADRDESAAPQTVTLEPGDTASAALTITDPGAYGAECRATTADKLKIYPPDNRRAVVMRIQAPACADPDVHLLTVGPVS